MDDLDLLAGALRTSPGNQAPVPTDRWEPVLDLADAHHLLPVLWRSGLDAGWWVPVPLGARDAIRSHLDAGTTLPALLLQDAYEANQARTADLEAQGQAALDALGAAGIEAIALKGLHGLQAGWWPDPATRVMRDLDILVRASEAPRAAAALAELGYVPAREAPGDPAADHEVTTTHLPGRAGSIDLHIALLVSRWRTVLPVEGVLAAGAPMSTTDAVIHGIAHAQLQDEAHRFAQIPLRALHELSVVAGRADLTVDWSAVRAAFARAGAEAALDAHLQLARTLFDAEVPPPRGRVRAAGHERLARVLADHPAASRRYERAVYAPRALSTGRMTELYGPGNGWAQRARHLTRRR